jgi:hypothetical protein
MKIIKTENFIKLATPAIGPRLDTHPSPPPRSPGPGEFLFQDKNETEDDIKKRWKKKKPHEKKTK